MSETPGYFAPDDNLEGLMSPYELVFSREKAHSLGIHDPDPMIRRWLDEWESQTPEVTQHTSFLSFTEAKYQRMRRGDFTGEAGVTIDIIEKPSRLKTMSKKIGRSLLPFRGN